MNFVKFLFSLVLLSSVVFVSTPVFSEQGISGAQEPQAALAASKNAAKEDDCE